MSELGPAIERDPLLNARLLYYARSDYATSVDDLEQLVFSTSPAYGVTAADVGIDPKIDNCSHIVALLEHASSIPMTQDRIRQAEYSMSANADLAFKRLDEYPGIRDNGARKIESLQGYLDRLDMERDPTEYDVTLGALQRLRIAWNEYSTIVDRVERATGHADEARQGAVQSVYGKVQLHRSYHRMSDHQPPCLNRPTEQL